MAAGSQADRMRKLSPNATNLGSIDRFQLRREASLFIYLFIGVGGVVALSFPFQAHVSALRRKMQ